VVDDAGLEAQAASPDLASLTALNLWRHQIGAAGTRALAASPYLASRHGPARRGGRQCYYYKLSPFPASAL
jgi:hypothetical protein